MREELIRADDVSLSFSHGRTRTPVLMNVSASFPPEKLSLIQGPSGSGKTTFLAILGCLLRPDSGRVYIGPVEATQLTDAERNRLRLHTIAYVFQGFRLLHSLNALENAMLQAVLAGFPRDATRVQAVEVLDGFGLGDKLHLYPDDLSGGEKQRVAIARAVICKPRVILADEPTASLDSRSGTQVCDSMRQLVDHFGSTVIVVSHDPRWRIYANNIFILNDGIIQPCAAY